MTLLLYLATDRAAQGKVVIQPPLKIPLHLRVVTVPVTFMWLGGQVVRDLRGVPPPGGLGDRPGRKQECWVSDIIMPAGGEVTGGGGSSFTPPSGPGESEFTPSRAPSYCIFFKPGSFTGGTGMGRCCLSTRVHVHTHTHVVHSKTFQMFCCIHPPTDYPTAAPSPIVLGRQCRLQNTPP